MSLFAIDRPRALPQDLRASASPTFAGLTLTGVLAMGANALQFTDASLVRDDVNILALKNAENGQMFRVYRKVSSGQFIRVDAQATNPTIDANWGTLTLGGFVAVTMGDELTMTHSFNMKDRVRFTPMTPPAAVANEAALYADTSAGKVRLMVLFPSGAAQVIATQL